MRREAKIRDCPYRRPIYASLISDVIHYALTSCRLTCSRYRVIVHVVQLKFSFRTTDEIELVLHFTEIDKPHIATRIETRQTRGVWAKICNSNYFLYLFVAVVLMIFFPLPKFRNSAIPSGMSLFSRGKLRNEIIRVSVLCMPFRLGILTTYSGANSKCCSICMHVAMWVKFHKR